MGIGGALGLPIAAAVAEHANWRALFWGAHGTRVVVAVLIFVFIPATPRHQRAAGSTRSERVGLGIGLVCLLLGVSKGADWGWGSGTTLGLLVGAVVVLLAWGWWELRTSDPLVDLRVTARPVVLLTNLASVVIGFAMYAQSLIIPQLLQLPDRDRLRPGPVDARDGPVDDARRLRDDGDVAARRQDLARPRPEDHPGPRRLSSSRSATSAPTLLMGSTWGLLVAVCICSMGVGFAYGAMPALIMGSVPLSVTALGQQRQHPDARPRYVVRRRRRRRGAGPDDHRLRRFAVPSEAGFRTGLLIGAALALLASVIALCIPQRASLEAEDHIEHPEHAEGAEPTGAAQEPVVR